MKPVRVRLPPSPTGFLHIGNLRTALYNWFFARKHGGTFLLRFEDTDQTRYVEGAIESTYNILKRCDITPDEGYLMVDGVMQDVGSFGPYLQTKRKEKHAAYAKKLVELGKAYYCFCTKERLEQLAEEQKLAKQSPMYDKKCRTLTKEEVDSRLATNEEFVIRLAIPTEGDAVMDDLVRGHIEIPWSSIDDQVILKSDGLPTYHLAATCDDHDMEITHVIRGEEWISSLPKHVYIVDSLGWERPQYAHLPLLLNPDRSKLSKRQGDVATEEYLAKGYLPEALINFIAMLGWNPTADREIYSKEELAQLFDLEKVNKAGAVFNREKLDWVNHQYIMMLDEKKYIEICKPWLKDVAADEAFLGRACMLVRDRLNVLNELPALTSYLFETKLRIDQTILPWKTQTKEEIEERLTAVHALLTSLPDDSFAAPSSIEVPLKNLIAEKGWGNGDTLWPLRVSLSGQKQSPGPFELLAAYGKQRSLDRIQNVLDALRV